MAKSFCACCGYHKRFKAQMRRYYEIVQQEEEEVMLATHDINLLPIPRPNWKPIGNPRRTDRFIKGIETKNGQLVTPHDIRLRHKQRDIRRQAAAKRKRLRQKGELPYMQ